MPIRPENKKLYPKHWAKISLHIRTNRAHNRCECAGECGDDHSNESYNIEYGKRPKKRCSAFNYTEHPITGSKVILTVAHLDHNPTNNDFKNLKAFCQKCHNKYDAPMRRRGMKERARKNMAIAELF